MKRAPVSVALLLAAALSGLGLAACGLGQTPTYTFTGIFASGQGLFSGSKVQILGLAEGSVQSVRNSGDHVVVTMSLPTSHPLPADVRAMVVAPELLGQRSVDLEPGYVGGARLANGAVIPESRTSVPVETNTILREVTSYLKSLQPNNVHNVVVNLAQDLHGQGQALGDLIGNAAGTIQLLARKGDQLGQLNGTLAQLTGTLDTRTTEIEALISNYDVVSGVVAQERVQLDGALSALSDATNQLAAVLNPNVRGLQSDLATLTTVGRSLDRNLGSVDLGLSSSVALFAGAQRAYDPTHQWLTLNNQSPPGVVSTVLANDLRDRLAGICRRIRANHSQGLSGQELATLATCGNPSSGYFNAVLGLVTGPLSPPSQSVPTPTTESVYTQGLAIIPGLDVAQRQSLSGIPLGTTPPAPGPGPQVPPPADQVGAMPPPPALVHQTVFGELFRPLRAIGQFFGGLL